MAQSLLLRGQAERCRRLARDCTDDDVRDGLQRLAAEYIAEAAEQENGSEDGGAA